MKRILYLLIVLSSSVYSQSAKTVFESDKMVWFGLDFTKTRMIGITESPSEIKERFFRSWNSIVFDEPQKFALGRFFRKTSVIKDLEPVEKRNKKVDPDELRSYNEKEITKEMASEMIKGFDTGDNKEGLGLVFLVETFNKNAKEAVFRVTFFDIASKSVLLTKRVTGSPKGFGLRNYWANALFNALEKIDGGLYKAWKNDVQ